MATITLSDMTFSSYTSKVAILIRSSGTYTLDNCTFDGSGTYEIEIDSGVTGSTTINLTNGTTALTSGDIDNNGSGSVDIINAKTVRVTTKAAADSSVIESARVGLWATTGSSVTIVRFTSTVTVTHTAHGYATSQKVAIFGADQGEYNGIKTITVTTVDAYTFTVSGSPTSPATGTIASHEVILDEDTDASGIVEDTAYNYAGDLAVTGRARKGTATPFYKNSPISGTITTSGFDVIVFMVEET